MMYGHSLGRSTWAGNVKAHISVLVPLAIAPSRRRNDAIEVHMSYIGDNSVLGLDDLCHLLGSSEATVIHFDHGDDSGNVSNEVLVGIVQGLQVLDGDAILAFAVASFDSAGARWCNCNITTHS